MDKRCVIFSGSPVFSMKTEIKPQDYIIACDKGYAHAVGAGVRPHLIVGDFDSYTGEIPADIPVKRVKAEKDDTDTFLAIKLALEKGFQNILLLGATGGRSDHFLANLAAGVYVAQAGGKLMITGEKETYYFLKNGSLTLQRSENCAVSVFSCLDTAIGVSNQGLKYPLTDATLRSSFPLGISNAFAADEATISVKDGILLIIVTNLGEEDAWN